MIDIIIGQIIYVKKDFDLSDTLPNPMDYKHKVNEKGIISEIRPDSEPYSIIVDFEDKSNGKKEQYSYGEINELFYNRAQWRNIQINEILKDD
jgi:hypothetical protein